MKAPLFISLLLLQSVLVAQPIIEHTDFIGKEDTVRLSVAANNAIDFNTTGPNSVWDYSTLEASEQRLIEPNDVMSGGFLVINRFGPNAGDYAADYFLSFSGIPFDQFGGILPVNIEDVYRFTRNRSGAQTFPGLSLSIDGQQVAFRSDSIETVYNFPLNYGDTNTSVGFTDMDFNPFFDANFQQYRKRSSVVDGHGTLITPFGTFNTLRVHHIIEETDSLYIQNDFFDQTIPLDLPTTHEYEWLAKGEKLPVLKITTQVLGGNENVTEITYRDKYLGLANTTDHQLNLAIYPQPATDQITISLNQQIEEIAFYELNGAKIDVNTAIQGTAATANVQNLIPGIYLLALRSEGQQILKKIIIQ